MGNTNNVIGYFSQAISQGFESFQKTEEWYSVEQDLTETSSIYWAQVSRFHLKTETESSHRNIMF
jgi:hypothetical protein